MNTLCDVMRASRAGQYNTVLTIQCTVVVQLDVDEYERPNETSYHQLAQSERYSDTSTRLADTTALQWKMIRSPCNKWKWVGYCWPTFQWTRSMLELLCSHIHTYNIARGPSDKAQARASRWGYDAALRGCRGENAVSELRDRAAVEGETYVCPSDPLL